MTKFHTHEQMQLYFPHHILFVSHLREGTRRKTFLDTTDVTVQLILSASNSFMNEVLVHYCRCQIFVVETDLDFGICRSPAYCYSSAFEYIQNATGFRR